MLFWNLVVEPLFFAFVSGPFAILENRHVSLEPYC